MAKLLEGKPIAEKIREQIKQEILKLNSKPVLASIQVGENPGTEIYIRSQKKVADILGVDFQLHKLDSDATEEKLIGLIQSLNETKGVNGIIIQVPLLAEMNYKKISQSVLPEKDAEGIHPVNIGKILFGASEILPCTPAAVMELLKAAGIDLYGREVVVVGHSEIVGKPLSLLLLEKFATVTVCHIGTSKVGKLEEHVKRAEVLIVAVGKAGLIKGEWIKEGAIVVDVGINRAGDKIVGDVEFEEAQKRASWITPVPGGVGPLTVTMLMRNLIEAAKLQHKN